MSKNLTVLDYPRNIGSIDNFDTLRAWLRDFSRSLDTMTALVGSDGNTVGDKKVGSLPVLEQEEESSASSEDSSMLLLMEVMQ
jgi:hypothetical protein